MKAIFYNQYGLPVMEVNKDARLEFMNGTRAIEKGATCANLLNDKHEVIDQISYNVLPKKKAA